MAEVISLAEARRGARLPRPATLDPETAEVFPGVSLADLWRIWARSERARRADPEAAAPPLVRVG